ncbi:MAG: class I SAM-dependent methyltransferase [Granulosicoccus sp.]
MTLYHQDLGIAKDIEVVDKFLDLEGLFLIDAGCGSMALSRSLAERGARVLGIDPDPVQAKKNREADTIANVGFAETGADKIPVESGSVDGVLFSYSLHHIPQHLYPDVFTELRRILKPNGFVFVMEPVASGELNEVMRLFHEEAQVRQAAQEALDVYGIPHFEQSWVIEYKRIAEYSSWEDYEAKYVGSSYNSGSYTAEDVKHPTVKKRFIELGEPLGYKFECPMKVTLMRGLLSAPV